MKISRTVAILLFASICASPLSCSWNSRGGAFVPRWGSEEPEAPRASASMQLTQQGQELLERGFVDDAISVLERSVGLDPANGANYYYLSEAWLLKENLAQAEEFHRLAELYLKDDPAWDSRIMEQKARLQELQEWPPH